MDLLLRDCARYLDADEKTVARWMRHDSLPAYRLHDQWRVARVELLEWAMARWHRVSPSLFANGAPQPTARDALERGGAHGCEATSMQRLVDALVPVVVPAIDSGDLEAVLWSRLAAMTAPGIDGIVLPRPRSPLVATVRAPTLFAFRLNPRLPWPSQPGFDARLLFVLLSPTPGMHLQVLARLAYALHDEALRRALGSSPPGELFPLLEKAELEVSAAPAASLGDNVEA